jgi:hypothetical protein
MANTSQFVAPGRFRQGNVLRPRHASRARTRSRLRYRTVAGLLLLWLVVLLAVAILCEPDIYWFSYFSVDYTVGFVRRGLAGEMLGLFPADLYFTGLRTLRWLVSAVFIAGLLVVAWAVAVRSGRSERRLMLALLVPVLPFGFAFAVFSAHPDLFGGAALAVFAVVLASTNGDRPVVMASATYGVTTAVLTLVHEAIPALFSLGAIAAVVVLARHNSRNVQHCSALLAVAPSLVVALATALLGQQRISAQVCGLVPHGALDWPAANQILSGRHSYIDYHDWMCRNVIGNLDETPAQGAAFVASIGAGWLLMSTVFGIAVCAMTLWVISRISGVPLSRFWELLRGRLGWVILGSVLVVPIFATSVDWVRWWVTLTFDVGVVYLLYASAQPEADTPPTRRTRVVFAATVITLALLPGGAIPSFGVPPPL